MLEAEGGYIGEQGEQGEQGYVARIQVSRIADAVAAAFMELSRQPDFTLREIQFRKGRVHWLTDIPKDRPAPLGMGERVPIKRWPNATRPFYMWANRRRTCDELCLLVLTVLADLRRAGIDVFHGALKVTDAVKLAGRTVKPIVEPHIHLSDMESVVDMEMLRSGAHAHCHSFVRLALLSESDAPVSLFLDVSYAQFKMSVPYYLGEDCTLGGVCCRDPPPQVTVPLGESVAPFSIDMGATQRRVLELLMQ
jgi:hypothetical protein